MTTIHCSGPGPHAPEDGFLGETDDPNPMGPALCGPCGMKVPAPEPAIATSTVAVEVDPAVLVELRARIDKATGTTAAVVRDLLDTLTPG